MRARLSAIVAAAGIAVAVVPAHATAGPTPQITDPSGDANGINDQGTGSGQDADISGPADDSAADITSVVFATKFKVFTTTKTVTKSVKKKKVTKKVTVTTKVPDGFTVTLNLSAAPDGNHAYDVLATHSLCNGTIDFTYSTGQLGVNEVDCLPSSLTDSITTMPGDAAVVGNSVVWTIPAAAFPVGSTFSDLAAETEIAPTLDPVMDEASGTAIYKVGT